MPSQMEPVEPGIRKYRRHPTDRRYSYYVTVEIKSPDGKRKQQARSFPTLKAARSWRDETRTDVRRDVHVPASAVTLDRWLTTWMTGKRNLKPSTRASYEATVKPVRSALGGLPLQSLTRQDVETFVDTMLTTAGRKGEGRSIRTTKLTIVLLSQALDQAVRDRLVPVNVAAAVQLPTGTATVKRAWSAAQLSTFLRSVSGDRLAAGWQLHCHGLRRGEVLGLRWSDVDTKAGTVSISNARVLTVQGTVSEGLPKSARSVRTLPVTPGAVAALRALLREQKREALAQGRPPAEYVISTETGQPVRPEWWSDEFTRQAKAAKLPPLHLHGLRHSALSALSESGVPIATVSKFAGHASPSFTASVYLVASDDSLRAASDVLAAALRQPAAKADLGT